MTDMSMKVKGLLIHENDQVVTVTQEVHCGDVVEYEAAGGRYSLSAAETVPQYHKISRDIIRKGEDVYKYGEIIGCAVMDIGKGCLVHTDNLKSQCFVK